MISKVLGPDTVLVVDDSPLARGRLSAYLSIAGYEVAEASAAASALELARSDPPDLVLLDATLPGMSTSDFVGVLKGSEATAPIPVVLMIPEKSGISEDVAGEGRYDFVIVKPVKRDDLLSIVESLVKNRKRAEASMEPMKAVEGLGGVLDAMDPSTREHSTRVGESAYGLARRLGMTTEECDAIRRGAFLHDIGKVTVGGAVLSKPGPLTPDETKLIRGHPAHGRRIIDGFGAERMGGEVVEYHHERWDGEGYPEGLRHRHIPLSARILSVVDAHDAMVSGRPYQAPLTSSEAAAVLVGEKGRQFDPQVVDVFLDMIAYEGSETGRRPCFR